MINSLKSKRIQTLLPFTLLFAYSLTVLLHAEFWSNILSPINACVAACILLFTYFKSANKFVNIPFLFYSLACFSWAIANTLWMVYSLINRNPEDSITINLFYTIPNLLILLAVYVFILRQFKKWNYIQLFVDLFFVLFMSLLLVWETFLHKDILLLNMMLHSDFTSLISIILNLFIGIGIIIWFLSVRFGNVPSFIRLLSAGVFLYIVVDMLYYYLYFSGQYISNSLIDLTYLLAFQILAIGALWNTYVSSGFTDLLVITNEGNKSKWVYGLLFPLAAIFFKLTKMFSTQLNIGDIALYALIILLYKVTCNYVQLSIENERLLEHEKNINEMLERRVSAQISKLSFLENQDKLTSLFNRDYFVTYLDRLIMSRLDSDLLSVILIDVDRFKTINASFGHNVGDLVLIELSNRFMNWNRYGFAIARLGGDEFALIIIGKYTRKDVEEFCSELIGLCSQPVDLGYDSVRITISLGAAIYSPEASNSMKLLKNADVAMYQAKSQGYNGMS